jgi:hypothetical protein
MCDPATAQRRLEEYVQVEMDIELENEIFAALNAACVSEDDHEK